MKDRACGPGVIVSDAERIVRLVRSASDATKRLPHESRQAHAPAGGSYPRTSEQRGHSVFIRPPSSGFRAGARRTNLRRVLWVTLLMSIVPKAALTVVD